MGSEEVSLNPLIPSPRTIAGLDAAEDDGAAIALLEEQVAAQYDLASHMGIEQQCVPIRSHELEVVELYAPEIRRHRDADDRV